MYFRTLRRLTADNLHNMDTGLKWFQGNLYVAYRQGDAHVCPFGKLIVQRSRDRGENFEYVAVGRGVVDTRDAHLYSVGDERLYLVGFESGNVRITGTMWTDNGLNWSPWTRFTGADGWWLWHPEYFNGKYYCAGYGEWDLKPNHSAVAWFESDNGVDWRRICTLHEGADQPNEASLAFRPDGTAVMLLRCERQSKHPLLLRAAPPYTSWDTVELDIPLAGPNLWLVGEEIWIAGRWFISRRHAHQAIFKLVNDRPEMQVVLPSGPNPDLGYMSVAQWPLNRRRYSMAYYSNHVAPEDRSVNQWNHPDIYLADVVFEAPFIERWLVSGLVEKQGLRDAACPDPADAGFAWQPVACVTDASEWDTPGLVDAHELIAGRAGVVYFITELEIGPVDRGVLHLGYDGPIRVWLNGRQVFEGEGTNPAEADTTSLPVETRHGNNRLCIALDTNGGKAWGIMARFEAA